MSRQQDISSKGLKYSNLLMRWRWPVVLLILALASFLASGVRYIEFAGDYRVFFGKDDPLRLAFEDLQNTYVKHENILFVIAPRGGDVFSRSTLAAIETLTAAAWEVPFSTRVDSLTNFQHTRAEGDDLVVEDLVLGAASLGEEDLARIERIALSEPRLLRRLVSPQGHVAGVSVLVQHEDQDPERLAAAVEHARKIADDLRRDFPAVDVYVTGAVMLHNAFMEATQRDLATLIPVMYLGIVVLMIVFLRSFLATLATICVIALSTAIGMGCAGWLGVALTPVSAVAPTLIMTLAVADSIHILTTLLDEMGRGSSKERAIAESLQINFKPVLVTSLTTAIGFLSMNTSDAPPLHDLGNITTLGVLAALLCSIVFLPALIAILPIRAPSPSQAERKLSEGLAAFVLAHRRALLVTGLLFSCVVTAFIPANELNENFVDYFDERVQFRRDTDFANAHLSGILQIEFSLEAGSSGGISEPEYLETLERFSAWWREQPEVIHVDSFSDVMKQLHRSLHGDAPDAYRLPGSRELAAQYLLLYELSLPFGLDLNHQINIDKSATRLTVTLKESTSKELIEISGRGETWLQEHADESMAASGVGPSVMFSHIAVRNSRSMVLGTIVALILISCSLIVALRSVKIGLISLVPNLVPAALGFGLWGLLVGRVGFLLSVVLAMTLGIVVDDTVHFLSKYQRARRELGMAPEGAARHAFSTVGKALVVTSLVLVGGFLILSFSSFAQNAEMGRLTAMIIVLALLADFFLLPPILLELDSEDSSRPAP